MVNQLIFWQAAEGYPQAVCKPSMAIKPATTESLHHKSNRWLIEKQDQPMARCHWNTVFTLTDFKHIYQQYPMKTTPQLIELHSKFTFSTNMFWQCNPYKISSLDDRLIAKVSLTIFVFCIYLRLSELDRGWKQFLKHFTHCRDISLQ